MYELQKENVSLTHTSISTNALTKKGSQYSGINTIRLQIHPFKSIWKVYRINKNSSSLRKAFAVNHFSRVKDDGRLGEREGRHGQQEQKYQF